MENFKRRFWNTTIIISVIIIAIIIINKHYLTDSAAYSSPAHIWNLHVLPVLSSLFITLLNYIPIFLLIFIIIFTTIALRFNRQKRRKKHYINKTYNLNRKKNSIIKESTKIDMVLLNIDHELDRINITQQEEIRLKKDKKRKLKKKFKQNKRLEKTKNKISRHIIKASKLYLKTKKYKYTSYLSYIINDTKWYYYGVIIATIILITINNTILITPTKYSYMYIIIVFVVLETLEILETKKFFKWVNGVKIKGKYINTKIYAATTGFHTVLLLIYSWNSLVNIQFNWPQTIGNVTSFIILVCLYKKVASSNSSYEHVLLPLFTYTK